MKKLIPLVFFILLMVGWTAYAKIGGGIIGGDRIETDSVVGAVTGIVEADGAGNISAATAGTDYVAPASNSNVSGAWEWQDGIHLPFGNDDDASWAWDAADARLELRNVGNTPIFWFDLANYSFGVAAVASPSRGFFDSDAVGTERTDEYASGWDGNLTTTTEDATVGDLTGYVMIASVKSLFIEVDGSDEAIILGDSVSGEDLKFDFETATDNEVAVSSPGGATDINWGSLNHATTGTISGGVPTVTDADGFTMTATQGYGYVVYATGAGTIVMPPVAAGMQFSGEAHAAAAVVLNPDASGTEDTIRLDGTALSQGDGITSTSTAGDCFVCTYYAADTWSCITNGWTDTD